MKRGKILFICMFLILNISYVQAVGFGTDDPLGLFNVDFDTSITIDTGFGSVGADDPFSLINFDVEPYQEPSLSLPQYDTPEATFVRDSLVELYFPCVETFTLKEVDFLKREIEQWMLMDYSQEELQAKFEIRKELLANVKSYLFNSLPETDYLEDEIGLSDFDVLSIAQKEVLYAEVEKIAAGVEGGVGVIPSGVLLDDILTGANKLLSYYAHQGTNYLIGYDVSAQDYNAIWTITESQDFTEDKNISFLVKSDDLGFVPYISIEFDIEGTPDVNPVSVMLGDVATINQLDAEWVKVEIDMDNFIAEHKDDIDWTKISNFSIVIKKDILQEAGRPLTGRFLLKDIYFEDKAPQLSGLDEVNTDVGFLAENKQFLESTGIPFVLPQRPYITSIREDREAIKTFSEEVKRVMEEQDLTADEAREFVWPVFAEQLKEDNKDANSLRPFFSAYLGEELDFARQDHKGIWDWYMGQIEDGLSVADLKRRLAVGVVLKPYVERLLGASLAPDNIGAQTSSDFLDKFRSYDIINQDLTIQEFFEEILRRKGLNYFMKPRNMGGTRHELTGWSFDSPTGRDLSIAATGFQLSYIPTIVENGWFSPDEGDATNRELGYASAWAALETAVETLRELDEYETFLSQYLQNDIKVRAQEEGVDILTIDPKGRVLTTEQELQLQNKIRIEEALRVEKEPEVLKAYLESKGLFTDAVQQLYESEPDKFLAEYSPIHKYGRFGMLYRYFTPDDAGDFRYNDEYGNDAGVVDNAIFYLGVLSAREYFKERRDIRAMADEILSYPKWSYFMNVDGEHPGLMNMGWWLHSPRDNYGEPRFTDVYWDTYTDEALITHILGIGSEAYPITPDAFYNLRREERQIEDGSSYIPSWSNSLFTFQLAEIWFDKRHLVDKTGINWYENTLIATRANREFVIANADRSRTWENPNHFPITTGATPGAYHYVDDQTQIRPTTAYLMDAGFGDAVGEDFPIMLLATNGLAQASDENWSALAGLLGLAYEYPRMWDQDAFKDVVSEDEGLGYSDQDYWASTHRVGFSEGMFLTLATMLAEMDEDKQSLWDSLMPSEYMQRFISRAEFQEQDVAELQEISDDVSSGFNSGVEALISQYVSAPSDFTGLQVKFADVVSQAQTAGDFDLLVRRIDETYQQNSGSVDAQKLNILIAQARLMQMHGMADIGMGEIYPDARTYDVLIYIASNLDSAMDEAYDALSRMDIGIGEQDYVLTQALYTAVEKNRRNYFEAKVHYDAARSSIYSIYNTDNVDALMQIYAQTFNRYDLREGEITGVYTVDDVLSDLEMFDSHRSRVVSCEFLEQELQSSTVVLKTIDTGDGGMLSYILEQHLNQGRPLSEVISWILTNIAIVEELNE
ncbi:MAG: glucoamylase family protein [Candidatus Saelkia tenebricola]|nr:glucoamylase family protein [Candidatus Saelkia tenebricola]